MACWTDVFSALVTGNIPLLVRCSNTDIVIRPQQLSSESENNVDLAEIIGLLRSPYVIETFDPNVQLTQRAQTFFQGKTATMAPGSEPLSIESLLQKQKEEREAAARVSYQSSQFPNIILSASF